MFNIRLTFLFLFFSLLIKSFLSEVIKNCELNSYCGNSKQKCSAYGNCNIQIFNIQTKIECECNKGYSSYDIEHNLTNSEIFCCYAKKSQLIAFLLELFLGFGIGHFYLGNITYATIKLFIEIFLYVAIGCVTYFSCIREHPFQTNTTDFNNNEINGKNLINENENENKNKIDEIGGEKEEKINDNNLIDNKNNESKDESFELEENKENERMFQNFISCPKSKFVIYFSIIGYFSFNFIDVILIAFGVFKDKYGEDLYLGS
jgi:TM2 domain-containing membrane protein YozV